MKLRKEETLHPEADRTLKALDAALAGEPVGEELAELRDLALALQAERPVPREEFSRALDARADAGFAKPQGRVEAPRRQARRPRRLAPLAIGTGAAAFIVATAIFSGVLSGGGADERSTTDTAQKASQPEGAPAAAKDAGGSAQAQRGAAAPLSTPSSPLPSGVAPRARVRKVERAASITLAAPKDEIEDVADGAIRTADRYGGFVLHSSVSSGDGKGTGTAGATIDLRIPSTRLEDAIADLSKLAHVRARTQRTLDITARFTSPRRQLEDATAERRALLVELARADTPNETASVRARLKLVNNRIDAAHATLRRLENRVDYAAVSVSVEPGREAKASAWTVGDAFTDALGVLEVALGVLVIGIAVLVPLTLVLAAAWIGRRAYLRHARNQALGAVEKVTGR